MTQVYDGFDRLKIFATARLPGTMVTRQVRSLGHDGPVLRHGSSQPGDTRCRKEATTRACNYLMIAYAKLPLDVDQASCLATTLHAKIEVLVDLPSLNRSDWFVLNEETVTGLWNPNMRVCTVQISAGQSQSYYKRFKVTAKATTAGVRKDVAFAVYGHPIQP